ncbi:unnamed protein product [Arctogadus glacialis]
MRKGSWSRLQFIRKWSWARLQFIRKWSWARLQFIRKWSWARLQFMKKWSWARLQFIRKWSWARLQFIRKWSWARLQFIRKWSWARLQFIRKWSWARLQFMRKWSWARLQFMRKGSWARLQFIRKGSWARLQFMRKWRSARLQFMRKWSWARLQFIRKWSCARLQFIRKWSWARLQFMRKWSSARLQLPWLVVPRPIIQLSSPSTFSLCERLAEECMRSVEVLKRAHAQGHGAPRARHEERTLNVIRVNPDLSMNDMMLHIIRGINLPTPSGVSSSDLDSSVKFEFPFPSVEEAQCDRTATVRSTSSPEFNESFRLSISRGHRGFRRLVASKGIRLEVLHKGGLFKTDKVVGGAQLKMDALENQCEVREILEVLDGRRSTGGKLEVRLQLREPLGGAQLQAVTEKWLVLEPPPPSPTQRPTDRAPPSPRSGPRGAPPPSSSPPKYRLHSFSLLHHEKEGVERKSHRVLHGWLQLGEHQRSRREPPAELLLQHRELGQRLQWQKSQLERGSPTLLQDYQAVLGRFVQGLGDSVKKFSSQGNREAAREALGRLKLVEAELESLKRKRHA